MALVIPNEGKLALLDNLVAGTGLGAIVLALYKNAVTLDNATVFADFTVANFSGYAAAAPFLEAATLVANKARTEDAGEREFTHNGGATDNDIFGYFVHLAGVCLWAEALAAPFTVENLGDQVKVTLRLTLDLE